MEVRLVSARATRHEAGATLLELVVVIMLASLLVGAVAPVAAVTVEAAKVERAQMDVETLARVLRNFHTTTGLWPARDAAANPAGVTMLVTGSALPGAGTWTASTEWTTAIASAGDLAANHLLANRPGGQTSQRYPVGSDPCWHGPYLDEVPLDPWGRPYVVNVVAGTSTSTTRDQRLWVISAGPDGEFQTASSAARSDLVQGDDIAALVWMR